MLDDLEQNPLCIDHLGLDVVLIRRFQARVVKQSRRDQHVVRVIDGNGGRNDIPEQMRVDAAPQKGPGQVAYMAIDGLPRHGAAPDGDPQAIRGSAVEEKRSELTDIAVEIGRQQFWKFEREGLSFLGILSREATGIAAR